MAAWWLFILPVQLIPEEAFEFSQGIAEVDRRRRGQRSHEPLVSNHIAPEINPFAAWIPVMLRLGNMSTAASRVA
ncbi:MAG: hypothetical protein R2843_14885 [Thermomicrobiales bacterium]